jgi:hypothetical protein
MMEQDKQLAELQKALNEKQHESKQYSSSVQSSAELEGSLQVYRAEMRRTLEKLVKTHQHNKQLRSELHKSSDAVTKALALHRTEVDQRKQLDQLRQDNDRLMQLLVESDKTARKLKRDFDKLYSTSHHDMIELQSRLEEEKQEVYQRKDLDIEKVKTALVRQNEEQLKIISQQQLEQQSIKSSMEQEKNLAQLRKQQLAERDQQINEMRVQIKDLESQLNKSLLNQQKLEKMNQTMKLIIDELKNENSSMMYDVEESTRKIKNMQQIEAKCKEQHNKIVQLKRQFTKLRQEYEARIAKLDTQQKEEMQRMRETLDLKEERMRSLETQLQIHYSLRGSKLSPGEGAKTPKRTLSVIGDAAVVETTSKQHTTRTSGHHLDESGTTNAISHIIPGRRSSPSISSDLSLNSSFQLSSQNSQVSGLSSLDSSFDDINNTGMHMENTSYKC